ncbi:MAG: restriction endonuclease [Bacillota bacterium]|nr:restriction endonuclease [Bacillota bacterium]
MDFEQEVLKLLQAMGFESTATSATRDGGIDILAYSAHA